MPRSRRIVEWLVAASLTLVLAGCDSFRSRTTTSASHLFSTMSVEIRGDGSGEIGAQLARALLEAAAECATVTVPPGIFRSSQRLTVPPCVTLQVLGTLIISGMEFVDTAWTQIQLQAGASLTGDGVLQAAGGAVGAQCLILAQGNNVVSNLEIDGNRDSIGGPVLAFTGSLCIGGDNVSILSNRFRHSGTFAITGLQTQTLAIHNTRISGNSAQDTGGFFLSFGYGGCELASVSTGLTVEGNTYDAGVNTETFGLSLNQVRGATITGNDGTAGPHALNVIAIDNSSEVRVAGNIARNSAAEEILLWIDVPGAVMEGNVVEGNFMINAGAIATGLMDYSGVASNLCPENPTRHLTGTIRNNQIVNNLIINADTNFVNVGSPANYDVGIRLVGGDGFTNNVVANNVCTSTIVGATPVRNGWNACVGLDAAIPPLSNPIYGNDFNVADPSGGPCVVRDLTDAVRNVNSSSGLCLTSNPDLPTVAAGFFKPAGTHAIFYSNGENAFCMIPTWEMFIGAGGRPDGSNVLPTYGLPRALRNDRACGG